LVSRGQKGRIASEGEGLEKKMPENEEKDGTEEGGANSKKNKNKKKRN